MTNYQPAVFAELDEVRAKTDLIWQRGNRRAAALQTQVEMLVGVVDETAARLARLDEPQSEPTPKPAGSGEVQPTDPARAPALTSADAHWIIGGWRRSGWQS